MHNWRRLSFIISSILFSLFLFGCSNEKENDVSLSETLDYTIIGIEAGAGISNKTELAIEEYDSLAGWDVEFSSTAAMMAALESAYKNEEPIIITGWNPHWMFVKYDDLIYLDDPLGIYGEEEDIHTLTRLGLEEDEPEAFAFFEQFAWDIEDMETILYEAEETGEEVEVVAEKWVKDNEEKVAKWMEGVDGTGVEIELASNPWDSERASAGVAKAAMEQVGFKVNVTPLDSAVLFESIANGDADATVGVWLPVTTKEYYDKHEKNLVDLGPNLSGAKIGLAVPSYMDINSIEDLEAK